MMRADALNSHIDPVRTETTGTQHIPISHVCDSDKSESKEILADETLLKVCYTDESESENITANESSTEESESESVRKSINTNIEKYAIDETEHMRNLRLQIIQLSMGQTILTYPSVIKPS